jgi:hypothetical protein
MPIGYFASKRAFPPIFQTCPEVNILSERMNEELIQKAGWFFKS